MTLCPYCQREVPDNALACPYDGVDLRKGAAIKQSIGRRWATKTETLLPGQVVGREVATRLRPQRTKPDSGLAEDTQVFRPRLRASAAALCILDDGSDESGETIWIRKERFVIGGRERPDRTLERPDAMISNDDGISALHAELSRRCEDGRWWWTLKDLGSRYGTFLRIASSPLKHGDELLVGHRVFRYSTANPRAAARLEGGTVDRDVTQRPPRYQPEQLQPPPAELIEAEAADAGLRFILSGSEQRIGREPSCGIHLKDDPTVSPVHARLFIARGVWHIEDCNSLNGVWLRITERILDPNTEFQIGQQRFLFRFPDHVPPPGHPNGA